MIGNGNNPAFPLSAYSHALTKREYFAVHIFTGMQARHYGTSPSDAVALADELLAALEKPTPKS